MSSIKESNKEYVRDPFTGRFYNLMADGTRRDRE